MNFKRSISALMSVLIVFSVIIPMPVIAAGNPAITISSVTDTPGSTVNVELKIKDNPGMLGAELEITFDEGLTLIGASNGDAFSPLTITKPGKLTSPCKFVWDGQELEDSDVKDGTILTLQFTLPENAEKGTKYNISAAYDDGAVVNRYLVPVFPDITNGYIEVLDYVYGDLNEDKKVNTTDVIMLRRHLAGGYEQTINIDAADVNTDTKKNTTDVILMRRFIAGGYGITFPYIIDGCDHILQAFAAKEATYTEPGNIAYWQCRACNKYFADEAGEAEITREETILPILTKDEYTIQYMCDMVPLDSDGKEISIADDTYKPTQTKVLPIPKMDTYKFLGWSDKDGKMYGTELPVGTTGDLVLYANWVSLRNRAVPNKKLAEPIICEDSTEGQILFIYEIGKIENIPLFETQDLLVTNGIITSTGIVKQNSIAKGNAEEIGKTIANTTTNSATWTLSQEWTEEISVSEEWAQQQGMTVEEAKEFCQTNSNTYNLVNSSGGFSSLISSEDSTYKVSTNKAHIKNTYDEEQRYAKFNVDGKLGNSTTTSLGINAGLKIPLKVAEASVGAEAGVSNTFSWEIGAGYEQSKFTKDITTGTDSWSKNIDDITSSSTVSTEEKTWNTTEGYTSSQGLSESEMVSKAVSEQISKKNSKDSTYTTGGTNGESKEYASSSAQEDLYSSSVTYSEEEMTISERTFTSTGNTYGAYRLVQVGMARVFAVVGYDIKNKSYYTYTYSVLDDDEYKEYLDYSYDRSFNDYETSVLPFEIPGFVNDYVNSRIASSKLQVNDNGVVTKYLGSADDKVALIPSYYTFKNTTTGKTEFRKITGIAEGLFKNNANIVGVSIGNFINEIPQSAFEGCINLKEIICPNVLRIGDYAFKGCTSLSTFSLPNEIEYIGTDAFDGIPALKVNAPTKEIANIVANSNIQNITLDISNIEADDFSDLSFDIGEIETFKLLGGYKEYRGLNIKSNAQNTIISGVTISNSNIIPIEISSPNVTLERVTVQSDGFAIVLKADETTLSLEGESNMLSSSVNSIIAKNINFVQLNEEIYSAIETNGSVLINGTVNNNDGYLDESKIVYISEKEYTNYLTSRKITFNANGGTVGTEYIIVSYNSPLGELPFASRDYYTFDGWYTEADGGEKVTAETPMTSLIDVTLYAHWIHNDAVWSLASKAPADAEVVDRKYTYTKTSTTTSSSSSLSGWEQYNSTWVWGDYGNWSSWQDGWVGSSDSRAVETRSVYVSSNYKTVYRYYRRANSEHAGTGSPYYSYGGNLYTYSFDYELEKQAGKDYSYTLWCNCGGGYHTVWRYGSLDMHAMPYTESVWASDNYKTQYRYRDRSKIYTYHYRKVENNLESSSKPANGSNYTVSNIQEWVQYRAK